ncbi:MAG: hypothetical protein OXU20_03140 [Myxococcales bacterium]|nr:hypothetical protein [Myxococcales bacterium]
MNGGVHCGGAVGLVVVEPDPPPDCSDPKPAYPVQPDLTPLSQGTSSPHPRLQERLGVTEHPSPRAHPGTSQADSQVGTQ